MRGPQTVLNGPGASAGSVMFERKLKQLEKPGASGNGSLLLGSYGRHDEVADVKFGNENVYARITGTNSEANDYRDGNDNKVHSEYQRYSANAALGFTPDANTGVDSPPPIATVKPPTPIAAWMVSSSSERTWYCVSRKGTSRPCFRRSISSYRITTSII
jgi:outer membrane receptor protein involved in Fe transport